MKQIILSHDRISLLRQKITRITIDFGGGQIYSLPLNLL